MPCRVCGREGYADICSECMFRELNQQCWRCRMYIPKAEMQQWRGQWICPNCRMDLEREEEEVSKEKKGEEGAQPEAYEKKGQCDRCGRETIILYRFNGRNLCWYCLEKEDTYGGAGGMGGAIPLQLTRESKKRKGLLKRIKEFLLGKEPEEEAEVEIVVAKVIPVRKKGKGDEIVPVKKTDKAEIVPKKEPERGEEKHEKKDKGPVIEKAKGEPPKEEKKKPEKDEKKKHEWGEWKRD